MPNAEKNSKNLRKKIMNVPSRLSLHKRRMKSALSNQTVNMRFDLEIARVTKKRLMKLQELLDYVLSSEPPHAKI